jgi:hypothetical protein
MPVVCHIPAEHPDRAEILRWLACLAVPEDVTLIVSSGPDRLVRWELKLTTSNRVTVCAVADEEGPTGVFRAAARLLVVEKRR